MSVLEIGLDFDKNPTCPHGPTILFKYVLNNGKNKQYYGCSACRDRKECEFYLEYDSVLTETKKEVWNQKIDEFKKGVKPKKQYNVFKKIKSLSENERIYCHTCNLFIFTDDAHLNHNLTRDLTDKDLNNPSLFLQSLQKAKKEAQYHFDKNAVNTTINILKEQNCRNVICVGTPRIFEEILQNHKESFNTILLDIDKRFHNFFASSQFCWFNSLNNHFFLPEAFDIFKQFLGENSENFALVTDPPFGIRVELLANTIQKIQELYNSVNKASNEIDILWFFPYFMEPHIKNHMNNLNMLDYKVNYDNHSSFRKGPKGQKFGSPVRIFTNIDLRSITLPQEEGYKLCEICEKFVYLENKHCFKCNDCTSKDGKTYVHCEKCKRCVKPSWKHCKKCKRCALPDHKCSEIQNLQKCFKCQKRGHKEKDCPLNSKIESKKMKIEHKKRKTKKKIK